MKKSKPKATKTNIDFGKPIAVWYAENKVTYKRFNHPIDFDETAAIGIRKSYGTQMVECPSLTPRYRLTKAIKDLINGIKEGYPLCCVINYSWDTLRNLNIQAIIRYTNATNFQYVPCKIHHRKCDVSIPEGTF